MKTDKRVCLGTILLAIAFLGNLGLTKDVSADTNRVSQAAQQTVVVNLNTSTSEQLQTIRGIGPALAERILNYRKEKGKFAKAEDLMNVRGIGEAKFEKIKNQVSI